MFKRVSVRLRMCISEKIKVKFFHRGHVLIGHACVSFFYSLTHTHHNNEWMCLYSLYSIITAQQKYNNI